MYNRLHPVAYNHSAGARAPSATEVLVDEDFPIGTAATEVLVDENLIPKLKNEFLKLEILWKTRENEFPDKEKRRSRAVQSISLGVGTEELPASFETYLGRSILNLQKKNTVKRQFCQFIEHYRECHDESDSLSIEQIVEAVVLNERSFLADHTE